MKGISPLSLFFLLAVVIFACSCSQAPVAGEGEKQADNEDVSPERIPVFANFDDMAYLFRQQTDSVYVINFWATWCKPCVAEMPYFQRLGEEMAGEKVKIILVSLDFEEHIESKLLPFLEKNKLPGEVLVLTDPNANEWIDKVSPEWGGAIPVTMVYKKDQSKFVSRAFSGYEELEAAVKSLL